MQLVSHRPSQSWKALHQFNGLPVDVNVKGTARMQVQRISNNLTPHKNTSTIRSDFPLMTNHVISLTRIFNGSLILISD